MTADRIEIRKNKHGWNGTFLLYAHRPYAAFIDGEPLRSKTGIRTFGNRESARKAAEKSLATQETQP